MAIDNCAHTFRELADRVLPGHMMRLRNSMEDLWQLRTFSRPGVGVGSLLRELNYQQDFSGCYVLFEDGLPIYVGISRGVIGRLRQHVYGKTHFDASLAFRIAMKIHPDRAIENTRRSEAMGDPLFGTTFAEAQAYLRSLHVATVAIENPLELYLFEPYCAVELDTHQWNSFRTH